MGLITEPIGVVKAEYQLWHSKWMSICAEERPRSALATLDQSNNTFSTVWLLLQIIATLKISAAQAERVFSKTERTLTAIRCNMGEERLDFLILLEVHRNNTPSAEEVVNQFAATQARRLKLTL